MTDDTYTAPLDGEHADIPKFTHLNKKPIHNHVRMTIDGLFICERCEYEYRMNLPVPVPVLIAAMKAWNRLHKGCCKVKR